jgi:undecaprenyl diphosphate synthase
MTTRAGEATVIEHCQTAGLDPTRVPRHVAIIMDGNGRWAKSRGWDRLLGHRRGVQAARDATTGCVKVGVEHLTLYTFSSENWERPQREVKALMMLLIEFLKSERKLLDDNDVRLTAIGDLDRLPEKVRSQLNETIDATADHQTATLTLALSYGGRDEIAAAARSLARAAVAGTIDPEAIDIAAVQAHLYAPLTPDVDVVIRTAGEQRLSNFLPWQTVYSEFVYFDLYWPDFTEETFFEALRIYQARGRRFGKV